MTDKSLKISVIIPVYNAGPYVRKAVESALDQPETAEVLLIEDGSPDNSLEVCQELDAEYDKVRFFTHENNANLGAGPTRNVGIDNARFEYIAFLDADDFYLPDRFRAERRIFKDNPEAEGVYGTSGYHIYSESGGEHYFRKGKREMLGLTSVVEPSELFDRLTGFRESVGFIHLNALTIERSIFERVHPFPSLKLCQDVDFIFRLSYECKLYPGDIVDPVSIIGVHNENRMERIPSGYSDKERMLERMAVWARENELPNAYYRYFLNFRRLETIRRTNWISAIGLTLAAVVSRSSMLREPTLLKNALVHICGPGLSGYIFRAKRMLRSTEAWMRS